MLSFYVLETNNGKIMDKKAKKDAQDLIPTQVKKLTQYTQ